jgi:hypothetical protein
MKEFIYYAALVGGFLFFVQTMIFGTVAMIALATNHL